MTEQLLAIELGPVVQLIAAARKTRDLFFGSWMLSEIAKAAARAAVVEAAKLGGLSNAAADDLLIAPAPSATDEGAQPWYDNPDFAVGDEILMIVPAGVDPARIATVAKAAAHAKWLAFATEARNAVKKEEDRLQRKLIRDDIWAAQTVTIVSSETAGEVVELYAAWVPRTDNYQLDITSVKRLLLGRTRCRNFPEMAGHDIPKSSLDGRRETVLPKPEEFHPDKSEKPIRNRKLRLNRGEQLDAIGVTKRVGVTSRGSKKTNYPSTARMAADPWIRGAAASVESKFSKLTTACDALATEDREKEEDAVLGRIETKPPSFPNYPKFDAFGYEGAILYENRHHEFTDEADVSTDADSERLSKLKDWLKVVQKDRGEPQSYYVVMVADGDGIGEAIRNCKSPEAHRELSRRLTAFANSVRKIVHDVHNGALIFAAGEDISALLPLDKAIACADALRRAFVTTVGIGSLSVGLAIGHFLDALEDTLANAREMEEHAKKFECGQQKKNALAVAYHARSGSPIKFRASWNDNPHAAIQNWIGHLRSGDLPQKAAYDLRNIARHYTGWPDNTNDQKQALAAALQSDVLRVLTKKKSSGGVRKELELLIANAATTSDVIELANVIIIASVIRKAADQAAESQAGEDDFQSENDQVRANGELP